MPISSNPSPEACRIDLQPATDADLDDVRDLLREYAASLAFPLDFQEFDREVAELPGAYTPPGGTLLVARDGRRRRRVRRAARALSRDLRAEAALRRPAARGGGLGRLLVDAALAEARRLGYRRVRLDTLPGMETAQALYERIGFREIEPYTRNPIAGARFLELELD